ncbi:hypothetical protein [Alicyclobacillus macrosporangiidus]|uniref:hypothetical protein n=1 Tax=Alicyclobacillus macrosporangiidus TaxID=392015 RepID=UPI000495E954|nr:hypothetical protein [Alicyclobacillus macrosporangiidus]
MTWRVRLYAQGFTAAALAAGWWSGWWTVAEVWQGVKPPAPAAHPAPDTADGPPADSGPYRIRTAPEATPRPEGDVDDPLPNGPPALTWTSGGIQYRAVHHVARWDATAARWVAVSPDVTEAWQTDADGLGIDGVTAAAQQGDVVWTGTLAGAVAVGRIGGVWRRVEAGLPDRTVSAVCIPSAGTNGQAAVVGFSGYGTATPDHPGHVYETFNGGATWRDITGNLPDAPVSALRWATGPNGGQLCAQVEGLWYRLEPTGSWQLCTKP